MVRLADVVDDSAFAEGAVRARKGCVAGDFYWDLRNDRREIVIAIPGPSGRPLWVPWPISPSATNDGHCWQWDGNEDFPTLSPSLHWAGVWHGWMREGELVVAD